MRLLSANLGAFLAVARQGTVHAAARELHLTQAAVTQRLRVIESELGTSLFLRSRKGMTLTPEGEALLRYCRSAEDLEGEVFSQVSGGAKDRPVFLTVVGPTSVMTARVVDLCRELYAEWPSLYLSFDITDDSDRVSLVRSGRAAVAIVPPEQVPNEMDSKRLRPDRYVLVGSPQWKRRRLVEILENERIIDFHESDPTTLNYLRQFDLVSHVKKPRLFVNNNEAIVKLFACGVGFGTLTQEIAKPHLESGALITLNGGGVMEDPLAAVWYPRPVMPAYFKALVGALK